jgi:hypothetical protein
MFPPGGTLQVVFPGKLPGKEWETLGNEEESESNGTQTPEKI